MLWSFGQVFEPIGYNAFKRQDLRSGREERADRDRAQRRCLTWQTNGNVRRYLYERRVPRPYCTLFALSRALSQSPASRLIEQNVTCTGIGSRDQQPLSFVSVLIFDIWRVSVKLLVKPAILLFYEVWKPALNKSNDSFRHTKQMSIIDHQRFENKSLILITVNQT